MLTTDDIVAITQVLNRVHHIIDEVFAPTSQSDKRGHAELLREVFTEDAVYDLTYRGLPLVRGIDEMTELMQASYDRDCNNLMGHHTMNVYVHQDEDGTVRADSKVICIFARSDDLADGGLARCYDFHDVLVETDAGWRIAHRAPITRWPNPRSLTRDETLEHLAEQLPAASN
jgi:hypothetical protein